VKVPAVSTSGPVRGQLTCRGIRDRYANREIEEHGIRPNRPIWTAIAALALGLVVQGVGCSTPEQRHRVLTIFFDGVPPLHPVEPEPAPEGLEEGESPQLARAPVANPNASVHGPVAEKECDQCHSSRYSNRLKAEKEDLCWTCHDPEDFAGEVVHGPVAAGFCLGCHDPHRSQYEFLLVSDRADLCEGCHEQYDMAVIPEHSSGEDRLCQSCHDPHAADRKYMLKRNEDPS
jgi:predicted CXXCH cytochrome family protein